jgi:hypothetical protein
MFQHEGGLAALEKRSPVPVPPVYNPFLPQSAWKKWLVFPWLYQKMMAKWYKSGYSRFNAVTKDGAKGDINRLRAKADQRAMGVTHKAQQERLALEKANLAKFQEKMTEAQQKKHGAAQERIAESQKKAGERFTTAEQKAIDDEAARVKALAEKAEKDAAEKAAKDTKPVVPPVSPVTETKPIVPGENVVDKGKGRADEPQTPVAGGSSGTA